MGVQLFGRMEYHCVMPGTDPKNVTINDLAIPDTMCSKDPKMGGYDCPPGMECMKLNLNSHQHGFYGMFNDFSKWMATKLCYDPRSAVHLCVFNEQNFSDQAGNSTPDQVAANHYTIVPIDVQLLQPLLILGEWSTTTTSS